MHLGFFDERDEMNEFIRGIGFSFLENPDDEYSVWDFLHGQCDAFAFYLSQKYGYGTRAILDADNVLVHCYCVEKLGDADVFVDVRGKTTDWEDFKSEFLDGLSVEALALPVRIVAAPFDKFDLVSREGFSDAVAGAERIDNQYRFWVPGNLAL